MAEVCKLSAVSIALRTILNNEELTKRLIDLQEEALSSRLYWEWLREGIVDWVEASWTAIHEATLKAESADIKFKSVLFWSFLAQTRQWDEALDILSKEIAKTWWTTAEWLSLMNLMSGLDLEWLEDIAKHLTGWDFEAAQQIINNIREKVAKYTWTNFSIVNSWTQVKVDAVVTWLQKQISDAEEIVGEARRTLWNKTYWDIDKDLNRLKNATKDNKNYRSTKAGKEELQKLWNKYWISWSKKTIEWRLEKIRNAQDTLKTKQDELKILKQEYKNALDWDIKLIEDWRNPFNFIGADAEWKFIKEFNANTSERVKQYWHYVLARALLTDWKNLPQSVYDVLLTTLRASSKWGLENLWTELSEDWILDENRTLDELMSRAYLNTEQLIKDGALRKLYKQRLISLASDWDLSLADVEYIESLIETMRFSWQWAGFSSVMKYNNLNSTAKALWIDVWKWWGDLWNAIIRLFEDSDFANIIRKDTIKLSNWVEINNRQLLELVVWMVDDIDIAKVIAFDSETDRTLLDIAWKYLIWNAEEWRKLILDLAASVKELPSIDDTRWAILEAITWKNIPKETPVAFFDFRKFLPSTEDTRARANFRDRLTEWNKINIPSQWIEDITTSNMSTLKTKLWKLKWWILLVNDAWWKMNNELVDTIDDFNHSLKNVEDKITVVYPRGWLMWQIKSVDGKIFFSSSYSEAFESFLRTISIRTLWQIAPDSKFWRELAQKMLGWDLDAMSKYNDLLEEDARKYFSEMLWVDAYDERLPSMIEDMTWISFKNYDAIVDKKDFWRRVDERFSILWRVLWKYDQEITTVSDILNKVDNMSAAEIATDLTDKFWFDIPTSRISEWWKIRDDVKKAYTNYLLSWSSSDLLENKWKLLAVINWWTWDIITISQFKSMLMSNDFSAYKDIFFHNIELSDEELHKYIKSINDMIFEWLCWQVADNLIWMGYSLPLVNIRNLIYWYLKDSLDTNNLFANAFLYKNGLDSTMSTLNWILQQAMPSELRFWYDDLVWDYTAQVARWWVTPGYISRVVEVKNDFIQDTYSSLIAVAAASDWLVIEAWWHERKILQDILTKYYDKFEAATKWWKTLSFREAQRLKTQAGYALDMYEQDFLLQKYRQFLTPDERAELFWLRYWLWIATNSDWLSVIAHYNDWVMRRYDEAMKNILHTADVYTSWLRHTDKSISDEVRKREQELIQRWATLKVIWWRVVVIDIREELLSQLSKIPSTVLWLEEIKRLGKSWLNAMTNAEVYFLLQLVQLSKNMDNKMNLIYKTIYKLNPRLANIDFFNAYRAVDWLPKALQRNLLMQTEFLSKFSNTLTFDDEVKKSIFNEIKSAFSKHWKLLIEWKKNKVWVDALNEIINNAIESNMKHLSNSISWWDLKRFKKEAAFIYSQAFSPYIELVDLPSSVKEAIDDIIATQQKWIRDAMDLLWEDNRLIDVLDNIVIQWYDWSVNVFRNVLNKKAASLSKIVFNTETDIIAAADEAWAEIVNPARKDSKKTKVKNENKKIMKEIQSNYEWALIASLNETEVVTQAERDILARAHTSARQLAIQYTWTKVLVDTDNALSGISEEIMRWFKSDILWFWGTVTRWGKSILSPGNAWENIKDSILKRREDIRSRYEELYRMPSEQFWVFSPKNYVDALAYNLVRYFREIESRCWSLDWLRWASINREVNMAFAHLWEVVMNVKSIEWLYALMSWVEWNEILKFFKFAPEWSAARIEKLSAWWLWDIKIYWYQNYIDDTSWILDVDWFNSTFGSNFNQQEYNKVIQALAWFRIVNKWTKKFDNFLNFVNSSNFLFRALMSWPWQLFTIHPQNIAYFLKQKWHEERMWIEDLWTVDRVRRSAWGWILVWAYNELNWSDISEGLSNRIKRIFWSVSPDGTNPMSTYNRYWVPDVDALMSSQKFYTSDDVSSMYAKIDRYWTNERIRWTRVRSADAYKDNANNLVDWLWARNFKNIAFVRALQSNDYMKFATAEQFENFLNSSVPEAMKQKALSAINAASWQNFKNILWLGFSWLDRAIGWSAWKNIWLWLMQMFNFRWAWWRNIARQTSNAIVAAVAMARKWLSKEWRDAVATFIAKQPEFTNFVSQLFFDLKHSRQLVRYQDNGDWMPEDDDLSAIDFIQYAFETMQFSSQRWQWIQSYWTSRMIADRWESVFQSWKDPDIYKDTLWVWALVNGFSKNLWRNWKVPKLIAWFIWHSSTRWVDVWWEYLQNEFWKLSFGTLRYLMNEDETSYWYSTELITSRPWAIPFIITWEVSEDGDKAFSYDMANTETAQNLASWRKAISSWDSDAERIYRWNTIDTFFNSSQMLGTIKTSLRALVPHLWDNTKKLLADYHIYQLWAPFEMSEVWENFRKTEAWESLMRTWEYRPTEPEDIEILIKQVLWQANYRPGNNWFNKSMFNFDASWHMKNLEESADWDIMMELLLNNIKYLRDDNFNYLTDNNWKRLVNPNWILHMSDLNNRSHDTTYMTERNYQFISNWVEENNDDPNYMLYRELIWEWLAARYADREIENRIANYNATRWLTWKNKMTKDKLNKNLPLKYSVYDKMKTNVTYITWEQTDFLTAIMQLARPATDTATIKMVERQLSELWDDETIRKIFTFDKKWNVNLSEKYKSYLLEQWRLSSYLQDGDIDSFMAETASITNLFKKEDPYWILTTTMISSRIERINDSTSLTAEQKAKAIETLMTDNHEFIQTHIPEFIDVLWDKAKDYVDDMNKALYKTWDIADSLFAENEKNGSWSWRSAALRASTLSKNLLWKLWTSTWNWWEWIWRRTYNYNFIPVKLSGSKLLKSTWWKWYSPVTWWSAFQGFKPWLDLSISKDIKRKIKTTKSQAVSSKKQISKITEKTTKATEVED